MSLTDVSYYFRKILPYSIFALIFIVVFYFFIKVFLIYLDSNKVKPLIINPIFSLITAPQIVNPNDPAQQPFGYPANGYTLDTIEGTPVTATDTAKVFFLPESPTRLGYIQNAYLMAKSFGFSPDVKYVLNNKNLTFEDSQRNLAIDVSNFNFTYEYKYANEPDLFINTTIPDETKIKEDARSFLRQTGRYPDELAQGKDQVSLFTYDQSSRQFVKTDNVNEATVAEVDFFRPDIDGFSIVTPKSLLFSQNYVVMVYHDNTPTVIKAQIKFFEKEEDKVGIYPVKTGDQAYEDLKHNKALIVNPGTTTGAITIKKMGMGYFDPDFYQQYLQPVYYFIGDNGFVAYVPAVFDQYIATDSATLAP